MCSRAVLSLNFKYLGAIISNEGSKPEILSRIAKTTAALSRLKIIWRDKNISLASKVKLMRMLIISIFRYTCESWSLTAEIERRIQSLEMRCYRRLLNISYKDHVTNERVCNRIQNAIGVHDDLLTMVSTFLYACKSWSLTAEIERRIQALDMTCYRRLLNISYKDHVTNEVCNRIQNAIGVHDGLLTMVKKRKLRWYGHISRSSGMAKTVLQGIVKGARRRGRQKQRW